MTEMINNEYKACFCDGSCLHTGRCGGISLAEHMHPLFEQETTTSPKPTEAEEFRRKADLAQRDKRAEARAKNEKLYLEKVKPLVEREAAKGNYSVDLPFSQLTESDFYLFKDFLKDEKGFYIEWSGTRSLYIDWKERIRVAPPTTEFIKQHRKEWD